MTAAAVGSVAVAVAILVAIGFASPACRQYRLRRRRAAEIRHEVDELMFGPFSRMNDVSEEEPAAWGMEMSSFSNENYDAGGNERGAAAMSTFGPTVFTIEGEVHAEPPSSAPSMQWDAYDLGTLKREDDAFFDAIALDGP